MRVIAGSAGGIRLDVPKRGVRPTMDRVKGAIFSSLGDRIIGARVLDLFAGSGGLGIEAISRGAASALFVEEDRQAVETLERNLAKTRLTGRVRQQDVFDFLRHASTAEGHSVILSEAQRSRRIPQNHPTRNARDPERFDIIFADPPYEQAKGGERYTEQLLGNKALSRLLHPTGIFILEKQPGEVLPSLSLWRVVRQKTYGATEVLLLCPLHGAVCGKP